MLNKLNTYLSNFVGDSSYREEDYKLLKDMIDIILSVDIPLYSYEYESNYKLQKSISLTFKFLKDLKPEYSKRLHFIFKDKKIDRIDRKDEPCLSSVDLVNGEKRIELRYGNTIEDSYTLTHEFFHYDNLDLEHANFNWHLMTEGISITSELLQKKWMEENNITPKDYKGNEIDTMFALNIKACELDFELELIKRYSIDGAITSYTLNDIFKDKPSYYSEIACMHLERIYKNEDLCYDLLSRDVIGGCISSHLIERIYDNPLYINKFFYIHENCTSMDFIESLKYLDLELKDEEDIILSDKSIKTLKLEYESRARRAYR